MRLLVVEDDVLLGDGEKRGMQLIKQQMVLKQLR